ncbi:hypothetical protein B296_00015611 [Ensete ventricosum]|uniref:Uncharacterized protein n=1 Tax=Ensete ventricosum TaxID=4639 RepID=A0A426YLW9_ENSVE|nr:hypothetical protein B296_00015611 [Ensete ventricosum]
MFDQSLVQASGQGSDDAVGNSLGVHWELAEGIRSLPRWRNRVHQKKIETHRKIIGGSLTMTVKKNYRSDMDPGSRLGIRPRIGQCDGSSSRIRYNFTEGIEKIDRNTPGDRRRKTMRLAARNARGYRIAGVRS